MAVTGSDAFRSGSGEDQPVAPKDEQRFIPGSRPRNDPQAELVRRYARILRSAPAEHGVRRAPRRRPA